MDQREGAWRSVGTVCAAGAAAAGADGYGVTLATGPGLREVVIASDDLGHLVEDAQLTSGQGPCTDAYLTLEPVLVPDLAAAAGRWPGFVSIAAPRGVGAVFAFPLAVAGIPVGAVDFFRRDPGGLSGAPLAEAAACARAASGVAFRSLPVPPTGAAPGLPPRVHQAGGMLAALLDVPVPEAIVRLRAYAYVHDRTLLAIAEEVLLRRHTLDDE
ncbi:GAF and ANTAR domain-containing protein [Spirillospora sp. CA-294931]|uniref:GAF and ANTAR domain-containing protein n=1 Tax=Spirillospora sp. CA-294931 TaxID=3240042 RepID=UPI003D8BF8DE